MSKKGRLVVVGSGIKSVGHITLEAQAHIQQADIVLYAAADPITDMWIEKQNPNSFDFYQYYGNDKSRIITYTQMIERTLEEVRSGKYVCALFYGHPGVFVTPTHNAIAIARSEGYDAVMLPAVWPRTVFMPTSASIQVFPVFRSTRRPIFYFASAISTRRPI